MKITTKTITEREKFANLQEEWNALLQNSASNCITLTHQWLLTWWDVFGEDRELKILLARENGRLVGAAPLLQRSIRRFGLHFRRLEFLASGEDERDEICSDYLDFLVEKTDQRAILSAMLDALMADGDWDEIVLTDICGDSPHLPILQDLTRARGLNWQTTREQVCIFLPLPESHDQLLSCVGGQNRRRLKQDRRAAIKNGVRIEKFDELEGFDRAFEILVDLHQKRWQARGHPGSFSSAKFSRFHRELAPQMLERGWLQLWILWHEETPLASIYDFIYDNKIFYYQSGMTLDVSPVRSPGLLVRDLSLEYDIEQGIQECDFLKGEIGSYKSDWSQHTRPIVQLRLARGGAKEAIFQRADQWIDDLRPMKQRMKSALNRKKTAI